MPKRIVVPLDGSPGAETILPFVEAIARPFDTEILLLRVEPDASWNVSGLLPALAEEDRIARQVEARDYLRGHVRGLESRDLRASGEVRIGEPRKEIVAFARETGADLIAMSTRGRGGLAGLVLGSVASGVVASAPGSVLLLTQATTPAV